MARRLKSAKRLGSSGLTRRTVLKQLSGVGLGAAGGLSLLRPRLSVAAPVTLSLWSGNDFLAPFYQMAAEEYAKTHSGFTLETQGGSPLREFEQKLKASIPTDTGPDLFDAGRLTTLPFIDAGLLPANPPSVTALLQSKAYEPLVAEYNTWKGRIYGIPFMDGSKPALFYNTRMFADAGLDPRKPPRTFDELIAAAQKLARKDASGNLTRAGISLRLSGQGSGVAEKFWYVLYAMGGDPVVQITSGRWHNNYDNDAGRAALKFYIDAVYKYQIDDPKLPHDYAAFGNEQAAMLMRESWLIGWMKSKAPGVPYDTVAIPRAKRWGGMIQPWSLYVTRGKNMEVAWDFAQFLVSPTMVMRLVKMTGSTSVREDLDWTPLMKETPQLKPFLQWDTGRARYAEPALPAWDEIETKMAARLTLAFADQSLLDNSAGIARAIRDMAAETDDLLKKAGSYGTT